MAKSIVDLINFNCRLCQRGYETDYNAENVNQIKLTSWTMLTTKTTKVVWSFWDGWYMAEKNESYKSNILGH